MLETLGYGDYAAHLNTNFRLVEAAEHVELVLTDITEPKIGGGQEYFSLLFLGAKDKFLPQGVYELDHEKLGRGALFLVPVGADDSGVIYEAVFNRLTSE